MKKIGAEFHLPNQTRVVVVDVGSICDPKPAIILQFLSGAPIQITVEDLKAIHTWYNAKS